MKGFRDLDPGGAEQVYATRKRRKEYLEDLEEELYARLIPSDYGVKPSESEDPAPARRGTGRIPADEVAFSATRRIRRDTGSYAGSDTASAAGRRGRQDTISYAGADTASAAGRRDRQDTISYAGADTAPAAGRRDRQDAAGYAGADSAAGAARRGRRRSVPLYDIPPGADEEYDFGVGRYERAIEEAVPETYEESDGWEQAIYPGEQSAPRTGAGQSSFYPRENAVYYDAVPGRRDEDVRYGGYDEEDQDADSREEDEFYEDDEPEEEQGGWDFYEDDERRTHRGQRSRRAMLLACALLISVIFLALIGLVFLIVPHLTAKKEDLAYNESSGVQGANDTELTLPETESLIADAEEEEEEEEASEESEYMAPSEEKGIFFDGYVPHTTDSTALIDDQGVLSSYAVLINAETGEVVAQKDANAITSPASMTKILTLLVAVEHLTDLDETVVMTQEIGSKVYNSDLSAVGYKVDDVIPVRDLLYGTILPSGADAAMLLAEHVAGSQEAFVELMNDKVEELGLSATAHFTNCVGFYDEENHCTMKDMAMILKAAVENELCREVLSAHIYTTSPTSEHPEGIEISNWFLRRIEDKDTHGEVICAKTGFVDQSGCCAASYQISNDGGHWICVTGNTYSSWRCIYDHVSIYDLYTN